MYIKSIVLEGFKSYGNRVVISGFDPAFNAITGLNGTGKSNILDAICFVLGITNLSNVRASSLQELIYKNGQAGITKAMVTIIFDNTDESQKPIGYTEPEISVSRQVALGGKNKYLINGVTVHTKRVSDLFGSVHLNVNNPHFLIMQGRITKVLNMKPPEILSMVEEAAGTRMYETKKQAAIRTIEAKDSKLSELNDIINEDIRPRLDKLADERRQFTEHQKVQREIESLTKLSIAWKFVNAEQQTEKVDTKMSDISRSIKEHKNNINKLQKEIKNIDERVAEINRTIDQESGGVLLQQETDLRELETTEAVAHSALRTAAAAGAAHRRQLQRLRAERRGYVAELQHKEAQLEQMTATYDELRVASVASAAALVEAQDRFVAISTGQESPSESLPDQLMAAKQAMSEAMALIAQKTIVKKNVEKRLRTLQKEFDSKSAQYERDQNTIASHEALIDEIEKELATLNFDDARKTELTESIRTLQLTVRSTRDAKEELAAQLQRCNFNYQPPPNFDRRRVSGTVCRLIDVTDHLYSYALEKTAGNKLYNVVVDAEATGRELLRARRAAPVTFVPLRQIQARVVDRQTVARAQDVGGGPTKVQLALDLIKYEVHLRPAMEWVFGSTLVCEDLDIAKRVAFHPRVMCRCVTLEGDTCDPAGTLSGGARRPGEPVLMQLARLQRLERELAEAEEQSASCSAELQESQKIYDKYHGLVQQREVKIHELEAVKARLAATAQAQLHAEITALQLQVTELSEEMERDKVKLAENSDKAKDLEVKVKDIKSHREREFIKASAELERAKKEAAEHGQAWQCRNQQQEDLRAELGILRQAVATAEEQLGEMQAAAAGLQADLTAAEREHEEAATAVNLMQTCIAAQKEAMAEHNADIQRLLNEKEEKRDGIRALELAIKELDLKIKELKGTAASCQRTVTALRTEHAWIDSERVFFGAPGGLYDFAARNAAAAAQRLQQLHGALDVLARGLNPRAHNLLTKEEEQFNETLRKKTIVEDDRAKLVTVMQGLDEKKRITIIKACEQVNVDFAAIFSILLPGAEARVTAPPGRTVLDGLQVSVGFNGTWKESLSELSGGQRSLVALSLVLAMLRFKPAPLYILDEVDAALDLSHTQNIGQMLRRHFRTSQFIIVSLKEGMFNNANVLFKTRFEEGMSAVSRTVNERQD